MPSLKRTAALALSVILSLAPSAPAQGRAAAGTRATASAAQTPTPPSAYNGHPKLAILLVIDQFRADYLDRYRADFKNRGFKLFLDHGAYFPDCYYDYANTKTAPGHATLATGAYTDGHGIANNDWWDLDRNKERPITSVEDEHYRLVGLPTPPTGAPATGASPRNLRASTIGDELRLATAGQAHVYGISLKDRAAILPAGSSANAAYWIDGSSGAFVTSTYYTAQLPDWATAFNTGGRAAQATQEAKTFADANNLSTQIQPTNFYAYVGRTPAANSYELDFARALITGEKLGVEPLVPVADDKSPQAKAAPGKPAKGKATTLKSPAPPIAAPSDLTAPPVTNLITISLSANDILGHAVGPDSAAERAMVDSLDTDLDSFFTWLDKSIPGGLGNVWIALSADHGIAPIPADAARLGIDAATIDLKKLIAHLNDSMNAKFSPGEKVNYIFDRQELPILSLNQPNFDRAGINEQEAEEAVQNALPAAVNALSAPESEAPGPKAPSETRLPPRPTLIRSYTRQQLAAGQLPPTEFGREIAHSYSPNGGWYVFAIFASYQMEASANGGTTHFSPWSYDRHVPLAFYGAPFNPGTYNGRVEPVDLAATWAAVLGINQPSASVGQVLVEALKPPAAVTYPKPAPDKSHPSHRKKVKAAMDADSDSPEVSRS